MIDFIAAATVVSKFIFLAGAFVAGLFCGIFVATILFL
jgi:hypothetical protein